MRINLLELINILAEKQQLDIKEMKEDSKKEIINCCAIKIKPSDKIISGVKILREHKERMNNDSIFK